MHYHYSEGSRFHEALRNAIDDDAAGMSEGIRSALLTVSAARNPHDPLDPLARRMWGMLATIRAGRADELTVRSLAHQIVKR